MDARFVMQRLVEPGSVLTSQATSLGLLQEKPETSEPEAEHGPGAARGPAGVGTAAPGHRQMPSRSESVSRLEGAVPAVTPALRLPVMCACVASARAERQTGIHTHHNALPFCPTRAQTKHTHEKTQR